jgi:hypothetical protein
MEHQVHERAREGQIDGWHKFKDALSATIATCEDRAGNKCLTILPLMPCQRRLLVL